MTARSYKQAYPILNGSDGPRGIVLAIELYGPERKYALGESIGFLNLNLSSHQETLAKSVIEQYLSTYRDRSNGSFGDAQGRLGTLTDDERTRRFNDFRNRSFRSLNNVIRQTVGFPTCATRMQTQDEFVRTFAIVNSELDGKVSIDGDRRASIVWWEALDEDDMTGGA